MTEITFPQVRIVTERLLYPETVERLLNKFFSINGIRRLCLNGPRLPAIVPYGPTKGQSNPHDMRKLIKIGDQEIQLQVEVGTILLELESRDIIPALKTACDEVFTQWSYTLSEGRFIKTEPSIVDYAKYGPDAEKDLLGLTDSGSKSGPVIIQGIK